VDEKMGLTNERRGQRREVLNADSLGELAYIGTNKHHFFYQGYVSCTASEKYISLIFTLIYQEISKNRREISADKYLPK
jgi:hypothetical protein